MVTATFEDQQLEQLRALLRDYVEVELAVTAERLELPADRQKMGAPGAFDRVLGAPPRNSTTSTLDEA